MQNVDTFKQEILSNIQKLSETTIERKGSRKAVDELSEKRNTLMTEYLGHEDAMLDARHEVETLEFLRDNLKASEKTAGKIKELETEIQKLQGLLEKSKGNSEASRTFGKIEKSGKETGAWRETGNGKRRACKSKGACWAPEGIARGCGRRPCQDTGADSESREKDRAGYAPYREAHREDTARRRTDRGFGRKSGAGDNGGGFRGARRSTGEAAPCYRRGRQHACQI